MSLRNKVAQKGDCIYCDATIVRSTPRQLWRSTDTSLAMHDAEYCPDSPNKAHRLAPRSSSVTGTKINNKF